MSSSMGEPPPVDTTGMAPGTLWSDGLGKYWLLTDKGWMDQTTSAITLSGPPSGGWFTLSPPTHSAPPTLQSLQSLMPSINAYNQAFQSPAVEISSEEDYASQKRRYNLKLTPDGANMASINLEVEPDTKLLVVNSDPSTISELQVGMVGGHARIILRNAQEVGVAITLSDEQMRDLIKGFLTLKARSSDKAAEKEKDDA